MSIQDLITRYSAEHHRLLAGDPLRISGQKQLAQAAILRQVIKDLQCYLAANHAPHDSELEAACKVQWCKCVDAIQDLQREGEADE